MQRLILLTALSVAALGALMMLRAQRPSPYPPYEVRSLFPRETTPPQYQQVEQREIQALADQGWELVAVMPYVYRNEERGDKSVNPRPMVTQTYPAYFFKRLKITPEPRRAGN